MNRADLNAILARPETNEDTKAAIRRQLAVKAQAPAVPQGHSPLEEKFLRLWREMTTIELVREHRFSTTRRFRFDFCHVPSKTAIELEGGSYKGAGRHFTVNGFVRDAVKYNFATYLGWGLFRLPGQLVTPGNLSPIIERCLTNVARPVSITSERIR